MKPIPQPIDELMWLVAEQRDPAAVDAFARRYPEYRAEMLDRMDLVRTLKDARPAARGAVPQFRPPVASTTPRWAPRWAMAAAASIALVAVGVASYRIVGSLNRPDFPEPPPMVAEVPAKPPVSSTFGSQKGTGMGIAPGDERRSGHSEARPSDPRMSGLVEDLLPSEVPVVVRSKEIGLIQALKEVERQSGLVLILAPGLPDDVVSVDLEGPAMIVLREMASTYGFSVFDQYDGTVNVIPAVDSRTEAAPDVVQPQPAEAGDR